MPEFPLCMVTGASKRLGRLFALTMARKGYAVLLHYHLDPQGANDTAAEIRVLNVPVYLQQADLAHAEEIEQMFQLVDSLPHPLRVLVNCAAIMRREEAKDMSLADWKLTLDVNLRAPFLC